MQITTETFEREVIERSYEVPVVVDFWAAWCGPCRVLEPVLEREAEARRGEFELAKVDVEANQELALRYGVQGIPAVKAFRKGQVVDEFVGALPTAAVARFLDSVTGPSPAEKVVTELRSADQLPDVAAAVEENDHERAFELLLEAIQAAEGGRRAWLIRLTVELFADLGHDHPVTTRYRRQLAATIY